MTEAPRRFVVIGDPIAHTKSPVMHRAAYAALGMRHTYEALRVAPGDLPGAIERLRRGDFDGMNVTVPHKISCLALVDEIASTAQAAGAANTLVRTGGKVVAHNTDVAAIGGELLDMGARRGAAVTILGSGGAARAAVAAAVHDLDAASIVVRARGFSDAGVARAFAVDVLARVRPRELVTLALDDRHDARGAAAIACILQASSAGMDGADPGDGVARAVPWDALAPGAVALDLVYAPAVTPFVQAAAARGIRAENGLGVLVRQGAISFELWLGEKPPLHVMRAAVAGSGA